MNGLKTQMNKIYEILCVKFNIPMDEFISKDKWE